MKKMTLQDQQSIGLEILKDVHGFCDSHGIKYSVAYGSLIGAIRHNGFIPWDDDVDIIMPRPDYERFCQEYHSDAFDVISRSTDLSCAIAYARVADCRRTVCDTKVPWCSRPVGIWIDVFPVDSVSEMISQYREHFKALSRLWERTVWERQARMPVSTYHWRPIPTMKLILKKLLFLNGAGLFKHVDRLIREGQRLEWGMTSHFAQLSCMDGKADREYLPVYCFDSCIDIKFEDTVVKVLSGYEEVLTTMYGDYRRLPLPEKRIPHNNVLNKWYWK
jgi:lipopolysaccharide cholinephosphotransferase